MKMDKGTDLAVQGELIYKHLSQKMQINSQDRFIEKDKGRRGEVTSENRVRLKKKRGLFESLEKKGILTLISPTLCKKANMPFPKRG